MACYYSDLTSFKATNKPRLERDYHTDGAVALVKYRGEEQLQNEMSRNLLQAVRTQMVCRSSRTDFAPGSERAAKMRTGNELHSEEEADRYPTRAYRMDCQPEAAKCCKPVDNTDGEAPRTSLKRRENHVFSFQ